MDDLGGCLPDDGPVHLVLHRLEESLGRVRALVVVDAGGVDHVAAKARMYLRLRGENPRVSGNASPRFFVRRSIRLAP